MKHETETLSDRLKETLEVRNIRPSQLAKLANVDRSYITRLLKGSVKEPYKYGDRLADILNISKNWLITGEGSPEKEATSIPYESIVTTELKARILPLTTESSVKGTGINGAKKNISERIIKIPFTIEKDIEAWFFQEEINCFKKNTLLITEKGYTPGSGIFLGFNGTTPVLVHKIDTLNGQQYVNKCPDTRLKGQIIFMADWSNSQIITS
ncbi:helix-turn-helix domain-containing protein [Endozoicomonas sp. Mp262]|uniref:helix-turn-helix domain-containing protein n=1 Tax=Endozoicomonas sp. Mp262 TaxID=2919499 RepID=UPI0021D93D81